MGININGNTQLWTACLHSHLRVNNSDCKRCHSDVNVSSHIYRRADHSDWTQFHLLAKRHPGRRANQFDYVYSNLFDRPVHANRKCGPLANTYRKITWDHRADVNRTRPCIPILIEQIVWDDIVWCLKKNTFTKTQHSLSEKNFFMEVKHKFRPNSSKYCHTAH